MLMLLALISNTSPTGIDAIEGQMFLMNCPYPTFSAVPIVNNITGFTVEYTMNYSSGNENTVVVFDCSIDSITGNYQVSTIVYDPSEGFFALFDNAFAWVGYVHATFTSAFQHIQAFFVLVGFLVTPSNFNILGFTIADLSGVALMIVVGLYLMCYVGIGIFLYKNLNPLSGGSS